MRLRITTKNTFKALSFHLTGTALMIIALFFLRFNIDFLLPFGGFWLFYSIPTLVIHLHYYFRNKDYQFEILDEQMILYKRDSTITFAFDQIEKIIINRPPGSEKGAIQLLPFESYYYAKIISKKNEFFFITCLMSSNLERDLKSISDIPIIKKTRYFATLH